MKCSKCHYAELQKEVYSAGCDMQSDNLYECDCPKFRTGYGYSPEEILDGEVWVEDDEGWGFYVTGSFGCVHFKERK